jgi:putative endonuclease
MYYTVYILYSDRCKKFYSGQSENLANRLLEHNNGETKSIKMCVPWTLVWSQQVATRSEAMALEKKIKSRGAARFLKDQGIEIV